MKKLFILLILLPVVSNAQIITTIAGTGTSGYTGDGGAATSSQLNQPFGIAVDFTGNIYFADRSNNCIRKIDATTGIINTISGNGTAGFTGDGGPATNAQLDHPTGICLDHSGNNLYIADAFNNVIRKIKFSTNIINTAIGKVTGGYSGDGGPATNAELSHPTVLWLDDSDNVYIGDYLNSVVRKVSKATGIITTFILGCPYFPGICRPMGICQDNIGNLYLADDLSCRVMKKNGASDTLQKIAGVSIPGSYTGDGGPATSASLNTPSGIVLDPFNNIYIADMNNHRVRIINRVSGIITTIAGNGTIGFGGDGGPATNAQVAGPVGLCFDTSGNLYITQEGKIRKVSNVYDPAPLAIRPNAKSNFNIFPNPSTGKFTVQQNNPNNNEIRIYNVLGQKVYENLQPVQSENIDISSQPEGVYFLNIKSESAILKQKIIINR